MRRIKEWRGQGDDECLEDIIENTRMEGMRDRVMNVFKHRTNTQKDKSKSRKNSPPQISAVKSN